MARNRRENADLHGASIEGDAPRSEAVVEAAVIASEPTAAEAWHAEAAEVLTLVQAGNPVSPARVAACLSVAVGLVPRA